MASIIILSIDYACPGPEDDENNPVDDGKLCAVLGSNSRFMYALFPRELNESTFERKIMELVVDHCPTFVFTNEVALMGEEVDDEFAERVISKVSYLRRVDFERASITDHIIDQVTSGACPHLEQIEVTDCKKITPMPYLRILQQPKGLFHPDVRLCAVVHLACTARDDKDFAVAAAGAGAIPIIAQTILEDRNAHNPKMYSEALMAIGLLLWAAKMGFGQRRKNDDAYTRLQEQVSQHVMPHVLGWMLDFEVDAVVRATYQLMRHFAGEEYGRRIVIESGIARRASDIVLNFEQRRLNSIQSSNSNKLEMSKVREGAEQLVTRIAIALTENLYTQATPVPSQETVAEVIKQLKETRTLDALIASLNVPVCSARQAAAKEVPKAAPKKKEKTAKKAKPQSEEGESTSSSSSSDDEAEEDEQEEETTSSDDEEEATTSSDEEEEEEEDEASHNSTMITLRSNALYAMRQICSPSFAPLSLIDELESSGVFKGVLHHAQLWNCKDSRLRDVAAGAHIALTNMLHCSVFIPVAERQRHSALLQNIMQPSATGIQFLHFCIDTIRTATKYAHPKHINMLKRIVVPIDTVLREMVVTERNAAAAAGDNNKSSDGPVVSFLQKNRSVLTEFEAVHSALVPTQRAQIRLLQLLPPNVEQDE